MHAQSKTDTWFIGPNLLLKFRNNNVTLERLDNQTYFGDFKENVGSNLVDEKGKLIILIDAINIYDTLGNVLTKHTDCRVHGTYPLLPFGNDKYIFFKTNCSHDSIQYVVITKSSSNSFQWTKKTFNPFMDSIANNSEWESLNYSQFYKSSSYGTSNCSGIRTVISSDNGGMGIIKTDTSENNLTFDFIKLTNLEAPKHGNVTIEGYSFSNDQKKLVVATGNYLNFYTYNDINGSAVFEKKIAVPNEIFSSIILNIVFSPNNQFLYLLGFNERNGALSALILYQLNLDTGDYIEIFKKNFTNISSPKSRRMLLGVDGKIYIKILGLNIDLIEKPDLSYPACIYRPDEIQISADEKYHFLPNNLQNYYGRKYDFKITQTCIGDSVLFEGPKMATDDKYIWHFADGFTTTAPGVKRHISQEQAIHLEYNYCDVYDTAQVPPAKPKPISDTVLCAKNTLILPTQTGVTYKINNKTISGMATVNKGTNYAQIANPCYVLNDTFSVNIIQKNSKKPFGTDTLVCHQTEATLLAKAQTEDTWQWSNSSTEPSLTITENGTYSLIRKNVCFADTNSITITFIAPTDISKISNVFTPNGDGINETWLPFATEKVNDFELKIYNRYGTMVYQTTDQTQAWSGANSPDGLYFYSISYTDCNQMIKNLKGTVMVVR